MHAGRSECSTLSSDSVFGVATFVEFANTRDQAVTWVRSSAAEPIA